MYCRSLVEGNHSLSKGIREAAALPYAVAIREIDDIALDLVKGQQLVGGFSGCDVSILLDREHIWSSSNMKVTRNLFSSNIPRLLYLLF